MEISVHISEVFNSYTCCLCQYGACEDIPKKWLSDKLNIQQVSHPASLGLK